MDSRSKMDALAAPLVMVIILMSIAVLGVVYANLKVHRGSRKPDSDLAFQYLWPQIISCLAMYMAALAAPQKLVRGTAFVFAVIAFAMIVGWWQVFRKFKQPRHPAREAQIQEETDAEKDDAP